MASLSDLSLRDRIWYHRYSFRRVEPLLASRLRLPMTDARIALVTSAGLHRPDDEPFGDEKGGDWSFRIIPRGTAVDTLICTHPSGAWDRSGVERDANVAFPLDRLEEIAADGVIGNVAPRHVSFQGSITAPGRLVGRTAPAVAEMLVDDHVDAVILTPV
jgi:D-proline reductase (dithiol) PrdB